MLCKIKFSFNPISFTPINIESTDGDNMRTSIKITLDNAKLETDVGWLLEHIKTEEKYISVQLLKTVSSPYYYENRIATASIEIETGFTKNTIRRYYIKIQDLIAKLGGLFNGIIIFSQLIFNNYLSFKYYERIYSNILLLEDKNNQTKYAKMNFQSISNIEINLNPYLGIKRESSRNAIKIESKFNEKNIEKLNVNENITNNKNNCSSKLKSDNGKKNKDYFQQNKLNFNSTTTNNTEGRKLSKLAGDLIVINSIEQNLDEKMREKFNNYNYFSYLTDFFTCQKSFHYLKKEIAAKILSFTKYCYSQVYFDKPN